MANDNSGNGLSSSGLVGPGLASPDYTFVPDYELRGLLRWRVGTFVMITLGACRGQLWNVSDAGKRVSH